MKAEVVVTQKPEFPDPQSAAIKKSLRNYPGITEVKQGKYFQIEMQGGSPEKMEEALTAISEEVLTNSVTERFVILSKTHEPKPIPQSDNFCNGLASSDND